jgi:hypothetical protein
MFTRARSRLSQFLSALAERGAKLDAALKAYCENFNGLNADIEELMRLGVPVLSIRIFAKSKTSIVVVSYAAPRCTRSPGR